MEVREKVVSTRFQGSWSFDFIYTTVYALSLGNRVVRLRLPRRLLNTTAEGASITSVPHNISVLGVNPLQVLVLMFLAAAFQSIQSKWQP